jgi:RNA polymerase sigma-54 factor
VDARRATLRTVAEHVAARQQHFVLGRDDSPQPLSQAELAGALGIHESTVSRAVSRRLVQLPTGRVLQFRQLFTPSLGARDAIRRLVAAERRPLSDRELAKYRAQLGILPQSLR